MKLTPEKLPDMQNFSVIFDICTDDKNSRSSCKTRKRSYLSKLRCCDVAVITSAEHAEGLQVNPGQHQKVNRHKNDE